ncbi:L-histidine N(alpha)-methyltransferase [Sandarakinorhabdus sp.]|uniref:L-histidine N(alpha)-methyltransferase n=1 Tax=Sandarakinorhabdus sp. TaxID=1916663 RepID=UPI00286D8E7D|nr:L-histidine N(alpha)-methyltransferase [Sandarakinorhabdus sp.]
MPQPLLVRDDDPDFAGEFAAAVLAGLSQPQKVIPARFFYDRIGSELFEAITGLPEYYPTRTEIGILTQNAAAIAASIGPGRAVIEFGSGSSAKTPLLLRATAPAAYVPVDISAEFLQQSAGALAADFPGLPVLPVAADFTAPFRLPASITALPKLGFFPGSTLGNLAPDAAIDLLRGFAATLGEGSWLLIGLDNAPGEGKSQGSLEAAYDDAQGVTAAFNLNLLHRMNRELGGTINTADFAHRAVWNADLGRIEMHLVARRDTGFTVAGQPFSLTAGAYIHTENSHKWTLIEQRLMARASGWTPHSCWMDPAGLFAVHLWRRPVPAMAP